MERSSPLRQSLISPAEEHWLEPANRLRPAPGGIATEPRDLVDAAEEIRATLGTLGDSLPHLRIAGQNDTAPTWAPLEDLVRSGAAELHRPGPQAASGTGHFEAEVTSQDILRGTPPSGAVPLEPQAGDPLRVQAGDVLIATAPPGSVARVATAEQVGAVPGRGVWVVRVNPQVLDPWFIAGAISGADNRRIAERVTSTLSGTPLADIKRLQIPVLPIETQKLYGRTHRRLAEFETLVMQAAERSSDIARELASGLVNQTLKPEPEPGQ